jgi:hypothetical protein
LIAIPTTKGTVFLLARYSFGHVKKGRLMRDREVTESVFERNKRRESEINAALNQENARHDAAIKNMHRLRLLRVQRDLQSTANRRRKTG